jgi:hypothetical protein
MLSPLILRRVMAPVSGTGDDALQADADLWVISGTTFARVWPS